MKHSIALKAIAFLLAACTLLATVAGCVGVIALAGQGLLTVDYNTWENQFYEVRAQRLAECAAESYAARSLGNLTAQQLRMIGWGNSQSDLSGMFGMSPDSWGYKIVSTGGVAQEKAGLEEMTGVKTYTYTVRARYPVAVTAQGEWSERHDYFDDSDEYRELYLQYHKSPEYRITVWITQDGIEHFSGLNLELFEALHHLRYYLIGFAAVGLLLTVLFLVYLCCAAGKSRKTDCVKPGGLNRLPLDIYGVLMGGGFVLLGGCVLEMVEELLFYDNNGEFVFYLVLAAATGLAAAACVVAFIYALAAQWKMGWRYIRQRSIMGWCCGKLWKVLCFFGKGIAKVYGLLPLVWKYLLIAFGMAVIPMLFGILCITNHNYIRAFGMVMLLATVLVDICLVCYGAYAYGTILKGARTMAAGDLQMNIDARHLRGSYKTCANDLNTLADVAVEAAKKQMKSERMKAELVTNVSHDIKTPLTSVINYIDLLQKAENEEQTKQYLEVLERQSLKLKKLIDDLMEMSKATTGDLPVEITRLDVAEAVNQALGEFADKLETRSLAVVLRKPEKPVMILADGRLLWRVLQNLMSNVVKYALSGTRVYVDIMQVGEQVQVSLKNISAEPLNISADELAERFVRGDASRNTEGSGLGLNIAKGFMQLQGGTLELAVDGDLFKVTMKFKAE